MSKFQLRIASPCRAPWDNMDGDARVRFCRECNRNVYNLSAMSEAEAHKLIAQREGRVCVRFYQRRDGTVLTTDCPVGRKRTFLSKAAGSAIALAGAAVGFTQLSACGDEAGQPRWTLNVEAVPRDSCEVAYIGVRAACPYALG